jgi:hypothetical protein
VTFVILTFILAIYGIIDQYAYSGISVASLAAYITGKIDKTLFWRKK